MMTKKILPTILAGFFSAGTWAVSYQDLDTDNDGYLSNDEAQNMPELAGQWDTTDSNRDDRIDKSEFAVFETIINEDVPIDTIK